VTTQPKIQVRKIVNHSTGIFSKASWYWAIGMYEWYMRIAICAIHKQSQVRRVNVKIII